MASPFLRLVSNDVLPSTIPGPAAQLRYPVYEPHSSNLFLPSLEAPQGFTWTDLAQFRPQLSKKHSQALNTYFTPTDIAHFQHFDLANIPPTPYTLSSQAATLHFDIFKHIQREQPSCRTIVDKKDRYSDVKPNEPYRVPLCSLRFDPNTQNLYNTCNSPNRDYINASNILPPANFEGLQSSYIATQAPLPTTATDFWEMTWQQHAEVIVFLTRFIEGGRKKSDPYWPLTLDHRTSTQPPYPDEFYDDAFPVEAPVGSHGIYGTCHVTLDQVQIFEDISTTIRTFTLRNLNDYSNDPHAKLPHNHRIVKMLHFRGWPDFGTPEPAKFLGMYEKYSDLRKNMVIPESPCIIHCSAGIGRTGTLIAIDFMLDHIKHQVEKNKQTVINLLSIAEIVSTLRMQRPGMVQQASQYQFIFDFVQLWSKKHLDLKKSLDIKD